MKRSNEVGMGIIDLLISAAIGSIALAGALNLNKNINEIESKSTAQDTVKYQIDVLTKLIERDVNLRLNSDPGSIKVLSGGKRLVITRHKSSNTLANFTDNFDVSYQSVCANNTPSTIRPLLENVYKKIRLEANHKGFSCFKNYPGCKNGQYLATSITPSAGPSGSVPHYAISQIPDLISPAKLNSEKVFGIAVCAAKTSSQLEVRVEGYTATYSSSDVTGVSGYHRSLKFDLSPNSRFTIVPE